jgi:hypothetical protein
LPVVLNVIVVVMAFGFFVALAFTTPPGLVVTLMVVRCGLAPPLTWVSSFWLRVRMFFSANARRGKRAGLPSSVALTRS